MRRAFLLLASCLGGCSTGAGDGVIRPIPGTGQVAIYEFCVSVSPDERWLVFSEWMLPKAVVFEELPPDEYESRIASMNLETGEIVRHTIDSVQATALGFSPDDARWKRLAGLELFKQRFRPPGWRADRFHFQPYFQGIHVALDADYPGIQTVAEPGEPGSCSDCPPAVAINFRGRSWDLLSNDVSAVVSEGVIRAVYYVSSPFQHRQAHHRAIYRITEVVNEEVVVEAPGKQRVHVIISAVRVSPGERYLAYVVDSKKQAFFSGPREEIFVLDLQTHEQKKVAKHSYVGNLIWSPDGDRLYFAGGEYASDSAVYIVDVAATFSPE